MIKTKIINYIKKETVLVASLLLAIASSFVVRPSKEYLEYIDFRVLGILLCLMTVMAGLKKNGFFDEVGRRLLRRTKTTRELCMVLVMLCFFFGMIITNDVALITFAPFAMLILNHCSREDLLIPVIVLQTIAANLGSMLTPIGNPQNLFLYNAGGFTLIEFVTVMLPYTLASLVGLIVGVLVLCGPSEPIALRHEFEIGPNDAPYESDRHVFFINNVYFGLFLISMLVVARAFPYYIVLPVVLVTIYLFDRKTLKEVDYSLLFIFVFFFIFTGNIGQLDAMKIWIQEMIEGRTILMGVLSSQVVSNVPATLLLSGFTNDYKGLLIGVNVGGLGTLIASMASLISYKIYAHENNDSKGRYILYFTIANLVFLALLSACIIVVR